MYAYMYVYMYVYGYVFAYENVFIYLFIVYVYVCMKFCTCNFAIFTYVRALLLFCLLHQNACATRHRYKSHVDQRLFGRRNAKSEIYGGVVRSPCTPNSSDQSEDVSERESDMEKIWRNVGCFKKI